MHLHVTYRVYTFRDEYRICGMAAIYSELLEDYFLTNINGDLFGDDDTKENMEEETATMGTNVADLIVMVTHTIHELFFSHGLCVH